MTLIFDGSMGTLGSKGVQSGSSPMARRAETTSEAVSTHRRSGEAKTLWIGNLSLVRSSTPVRKARRCPASIRGGSHGLAALKSHDSTKWSIRSLCRITTTFWKWCACLGANEGESIGDGDFDGFWKQKDWTQIRSQSRGCLKG